MKELKKAPCSCNHNVYQFCYFVVERGNSEFCPYIPITTSVHSAVLNSSYENYLTCKGLWVIT
jgi:hypothetical protein